MCDKEDWINDYLTVGDKLKVKIAGKAKNRKYRVACDAWKTSEALTVQNFESAAVKEGTHLLNQNSSCSYDSQILDQSCSEDESCNIIVKKGDILLPIETSSDNCTSSDPRSKGINDAPQTIKAAEEKSGLLREKLNMGLNDTESDSAEDTAVTNPVYNTFVKDAQTLVSNLEPLGSMLVVGSLLWKELVAKESETADSLSDCRFTDAEVTAIQPVSGTTAVVTVAGPHGPVQAFFNEIDAYKIDTTSNDKIYCTVIKLPETGRFKETHAVWILWQGMPPAVHEVFSVFKTEYSHALILSSEVQYVGVIVGLFPPYVGLMKIAFCSSVSVPVLIHVNSLSACKEILSACSSGSWIIDYVSVGDTLTVSIESTKNASLKEIGIKWRVKKVWKNNNETASSCTLADDVGTFRGVVSSVYSRFGVITFETGGSIKRALFFKDKTNVNWQELKAIVALKKNYEVLFRVKPECFNPKSALWLASDVMKVEECADCPPENSCLDNGVVKNKIITGFVEQLEPEIGLAVFKLCGRYERAIFPYTKIFHNGSQLEPELALTMLRINMRLNIKIQRIRNSEQETVKFIAEYIEIQPDNNIQGSGNKAVSVPSITNLLVNKLNVAAELEDDDYKVLRGLKGKIKYNKLGTGIIEFKYKNEDYEVSFDQSTNILTPAQGSRNLSDLWPTGKSVHFNLLCNNSMTELHVDCVWENKKPKKVVFKNAPELLPIERDSVKSGGMYQAKVVQVKKFSFVAEIEMHDVVTTVFVRNVSFHPFSDTRKLSCDECVALHVDKGDIVYVVVERSKNGEVNEWFALEAWKEAAESPEVPSATLQLLRNSQIGQEAQIVTLSPTEGQLQTVAGIVLSFVKDDVYLFGVPLKSVDLTDILSVGDTVNFSVDDGSITIDQRVFVSKVWIGCYEILSFAETYGAIAQYRSSRGWTPHVFEALMKELGKHRQVQNENTLEHALQITENVSEDVHSLDDILKSAVGSKSENMENKKLSTKGNINFTIPAHSSKTYASALKAQENILPCGSKHPVNLDNKNEFVLDADVRGIMEMSLNEIMCTYNVNNSSEFSSHVLHNVEYMVQKELLKKFLPAAVSNAVMHFSADKNESFNLQDAKQADAWASGIADMWKRRIQVLLENHFHFQDDDLYEQNNLELSRSEADSSEMSTGTNDTLHNMPVVTESSTQTTSTGKVIYLNIYAGANDEVNQS